MITYFANDGSEWRGETNNGWVNIKTQERITDDEMEIKIAEDRYENKIKSHS